MSCSCDARSKRKSGWWCVHNDPCGLCCVVLTYGLLTFADYVVDHALLRPWLGETANYYALKCSFFLISFLAMFSHARAMTTDPGAVPLEYQPDTLLGAESIVAVLMLNSGSHSARCTAEELARCVPSPLPPDQA